MKVRAIVPELAIYSRTRRFELEQGETEVEELYLDVPRWAQPGEYQVRFSISSDETRRIKHRPIFVE